MQRRQPEIKLDVLNNLLSGSLAKEFSKQSTGSNWIII